MLLLALRQCGNTIEKPFFPKDVTSVQAGRQASRQAAAED
jgi:hypothetical protein